MDIERRSAVPPPKKDSQTDKPNQPSGSGSATQPPNDQADSILPSFLNPNNYASKKSLAQGMLDLALLSANAAQLKFVLTTWDHLNFREILLSLVILSIFLQIFQAVVCVILGLVFDINKVDQQKSADIINNVSVSIAVVVVTINVVISAFDIKNSSDKKTV